jgi:hypothetical protein
MPSDIDISSLMESLSNWERAGWYATIAVAVGVAAESIHEFSKVFKWCLWWKEKGGKASAWVLVMALAFEVLTQNETNSITGRIISSSNLKTENLRKQNLDLEATLAPRMIDQANFADSLREFSGTSALIESVDDWEAWSLAGQIAMVLDVVNARGARWNVLPGMRRRTDNSSFFDLVAVQATPGRVPEGDRSMEAAKALVAVLTKNRIAAIVAAGEGLPPNTVRIRIGLKPNAFFDRNRQAPYGNKMYK